MRKHKPLTDVAVRHAKPKLLASGALDRNEIPDPGCPGLYLSIQVSGARGFAHRYRFAGKTRRDVLEGNWPALTLAEARVQVAKARALVAQGIDPKPKDESKPGPAGAGETFAQVATDYWKRRASGKKPIRSAPRSLHELERLVFPTLGHRLIAEIKRSDVVCTLDAIAAERGERTHDVTLANIMQVMMDHARRSDSYSCPLVRGMRRLKPKDRMRDRTLDDGELRKVWTTAETNGLFGAFVRFLLLTGCRRNEAAFMTWSELSVDGRWTLPAARSKIKAEVCRPLGRDALAVLAQLPRGDSGDLVFRATAGRPLHKSFADRKAKFDRAAGVFGWRLHDLRRTARSLLSRAGQPADIGERILGHVISGMRGNYDKWHFGPQMLEAYDALAKLVRRIAYPEDNVVELERRA
jgi:integrase